MTGIRHAAHGPDRGALADERRRALVLAIALNALALVAQVAGGIAFGSLALLADSAHLASDVAALVIALVALRLAARPATARHTYGLERAEVMGALLNGVLLVGVSVWIVVDAVGRLDDPPSVDGWGVVAVGLLGLAVNGVSAWRVARTAGASLNLRGAVLHLVSDAVGSLAVLAAGLAVAVFDAPVVDPIASIGIALLVLVGALRLARDAIVVLLEAVPAGVRVDEVEAALAGVPGVAAVHHLHIWSVGSETPALSAHVVLDGEPTLHEAQARAAVLRELLDERFGIAHATLEVECHPCDPVADPDAPPGEEPGTVPRGQPGR